jgi:hypothetical protein
MIGSFKGKQRGGSTLPTFRILLNDFLLEALRTSLHSPNLRRDNITINFRPPSKGSGKDASRDNYYVLHMSDEIWWDRWESVQ